MKVIVGINRTHDGTPVGVEFLDLSDDAQETIISPRDSATLIRPKDLVAHLNDNKDQLQQSGWMEECNLPLAEEGLTKWNALVRQCNNHLATVEVKKLSLTEHDVIKSQ